MAGTAGNYNTKSPGRGKSVATGEIPLYNRKNAKEAAETEAERYMREALALAREAALAGETPVGAVVVDAQGRIVGRGRNRTEEIDATCHAETEAIRDASAKLGWRLGGCCLVVTMEPCPMCAGAILNARLDAVYYGARDSRAGACGGVFNLFMEPLDRRVRVYGGILEAECRELLGDFFRQKRQA